MPNTVSIQSLKQAVLLRTCNVKQVEQGKIYNEILAQEDFNTLGEDLDKFIEKHINEVVYKIICEKGIELLYGDYKQSLAEVFFKIHDNKEKLIGLFLGGSNIDGYLMTIAKNIENDSHRIKTKQEKIINTLSKQVEKSKVYSTSFNEDFISIESRVLRQALVLLEEYSIKQSTGFELRHFQEMKFQEIANKMSISPTAARNLAEKARKKLYIIVRELSGVSESYKGNFIYSGK